MVAIRQLPFAAESIASQPDIDPARCAFVTLKGEMSELVGNFLVKDARSVAYSAGKPSNGSKSRAVAASLGLGVFSFSHEGTAIHAVHEELGEPVGTDCGAQFYRHLVLVVAGPELLPAVESFCNQLLAAADRTETRTYTVYRWQVQHQYWRRDEVVEGRPISSVVLPRDVEERVTSDIDEFLCPETREWYRNHGIPYRRGYLLHGSPGAGKTSLLGAVAAHYSRNLCYLSPTHPEMTDDALKNAVSRAPASSIIILEDVDALFGPKRENKIEKSPLTFSGLLNALDGVGGTAGQLFVLTTNHKERLDPALIRAGRVDVHLSFGPASADQMERLYANFYPQASAALGAEFARGLTAALGERTVSMAALQQHFITMRRQTAQEAATNVSRIIAEIDERGGQVEQREGGDKTEPAAESEATAPTDPAAPSAGALERALKRCLDVMQPLADGMRSSLRSGGVPLTGEKPACIAA